MGNENLDDTTSQQPGAENPESGTGGSDQSSSEQERNGVQDRINELTAKFRAAERRAEASDAQVRELTAVIAQRLSQPQQQPVQESEEEIAERQRIARYLNPVQEELRKIQAQLAATTIASEVQARVGSEYPVEVVQLASKVMADWKMNGVQGNLDDALDYAYGKYSRGQMQQGRSADAQRQNFNRGAANVQGGQGGGAVRKGPKTLSEAEIEQLSPDQQEAYYASRIDPNEVF